MTDSFVPELNVLLYRLFGSDDGRTVAEKIGVKSPQVSDWLSGKDVPSPVRLALIAQMYDPAKLPQLLLAAAIADASKPKHKDDRRWDEAVAFLKHYGLHEVLARPAPEPRPTGRTLSDFPASFYPLVVVVGDKREEIDSSRLSIADLGVRSASPGDLRWLPNLGLRSDVVVHIDKDFVLLPMDELVRRFAHKNLLVVGSPKASHLARTINYRSIFHFRYDRWIAEAIEKEIAAGRSCKSHFEFSAHADRVRKDLAKRLHQLSMGGIFDPTFKPLQLTDPDAFYTAFHTTTETDFGVLSFAENPYYAEWRRRQKLLNDHKFVCIFAAGINHPATSHAIRMLGEDRREASFARHPYGGVLRVTGLDQAKSPPDRVADSNCSWEDEVASGRKAPDDQRHLLLDQLEAIAAARKKGTLGHLPITEEDANACRTLVESL